MNLRQVVESRVVSLVLDLPERIQRVLGGKPIVLDGQSLAADIQLMLRAQRLAGKERMVAPSLEKGRVELVENARLVAGRQPIGAVRTLEVAGREARHYLPHGARPANQPQPLLVFFHGGGFVYGDLDSHDAPCRVLAEAAGVQVLSIDYRRGPEHAFPAAFDDAEAAVRWAHENADELEVDPTRIAVGGDSAGGNIAAWAAIASARAGIAVAFQALVYPCVDVDRDTESLRLFSDGFYLTADSIAYFNDTYLPLATDRLDERVNLLEADLPETLAPALVVTAGFDPLRDEGESYARRLADSGVQVELIRCADQVHGFLNIVGAGRTSRAAVLQIADRLRAALT